MLVGEVSLEAGLLLRNSAAVTLPTFGGSLELWFGESLFLIIVIINKFQLHPIAPTDKFMIIKILNKYLIGGIVLALPFFILNILVVLKSPFILLFRPEAQTTGYEQVLILGLLSLVLIGGIVSLYPIVKNRRLMLLNILVGFFLVGFSIMAAYGLGLDIYHCDILQIPNCD